MKHLWRIISGWGIAVGILALVAGLAWLSHHPEAEVLRRAQDWPWVGSLVLRWREAYVRAERRPGRPPGEAEPAEGAEGPSPAERFSPPVPEPAGGFPELWVLAGTELREAPRARAARRHRFGATTLVAQLERRGDWFRVWRRGLEGWVYLEDYEEPPLGREAEPPGPLEPRPPDAEKLAAARALLGAGERVLTLGAYTLYTDLAGDELIAPLARLVPSLEGTYTRRYGLTPLGRPRAVLVLYTDEAAYRHLQETHLRLRGLHSAGFNAHGLAVSFVGGRQPSEVLATVVHELAHLLNRRALGPALPPWIDEGIADDLAMLRIGADGALEPDSLAGERRSLGPEIRYTGALSALHQLDARDRAGRLRPLDELMALDWASFVGPDGAVHYAQAAFWIRFLLTGSQGRRAEGLRAFLRAVAAGEPATAERLAAELEAEWPALDSAFRAWLAFQTERPEFHVVEGSTL